jgi:outer membrane protein assembly factor BamE (lipoprotein component of BamABCDE complex)
MKTLLTIIFISLISLSACMTPKNQEVCEVRQCEVTPVAQLAMNEVKVGMTTDQVRALFGRPLGTKTFSDGTEIWEYKTFADCARAGYVAPATELRFKGGILQDKKLY